MIALLFGSKIMLWHSSKFHWCSKFLWCDVQSFTSQEKEVRHLISCQPTALNAVRLQALIPPKLVRETENDSLHKLDVSSAFSSFFEWHLALYFNLFLFFSEGTCGMFDWRRLGTHGQEGRLICCQYEANYDLFHDSHYQLHSHSLLRLLLIFQLPFCDHAVHNIEVIHSCRSFRIMISNL